MAEEDRRDGARIATRFQALHSSERHEGAGVLVDLSEHGARLEDAGALPPLGAYVRIQARVPDRREPLELSGRISRYAGNGFAIEFEKPQPGIRRLIDCATPLAAAPTAEAQRPAGSAGAARPGQREARAHCFADGTWISGSVFVPGRRMLIDLLNQDDHPFLRLRDASLPGAGRPLAFLALRTDALSAVVPADSAEALVQDSVGRYTARRVTFLLRGCAITGSLDVLANLRVSDHLMNTTGFVSVRDVTFQLAGADASGKPTRAAAAIVNTRRVLGVSES